ncbi:Ttn, partial [Symbiodinium necroappetens]
DLSLNGTEYVAYLHNPPKRLFLQLKVGSAPFALVTIHLPHDQREDAFDVWTSTLEQLTQALGNVPVGHSVFVGGDFNQPLHNTQDTFSPMAQLRLLLARFRLRVSEDVGPTWHARGLEAPLEFILFRHEGMLGSATKCEDLRVALPSDHDLVSVRFQAALQAHNRNRRRRDRCGRWCLQTERWEDALAQMPDDPTEADLSSAFSSCSFRPKFPRYRDSELIRDLIRRRKVSVNSDERAALAQEIAYRRADDKASFKQAILDRARTGDFAAISHLRRSAAQTKVAGSYIQARGGQNAATKELKEFYDVKYDTNGPGPSAALIAALRAKTGTAAGSDGVTYEALLAFAASDKAFKLVNLLNSPIALTPCLCKVYSKGSQAIDGAAAASLLLQIGSARLQHRSNLTTPLGRYGSFVRTPYSLLGTEMALMGTATPPAVRRRHSRRGQRHLLYLGVPLSYDFRPMTCFAKSLGKCANTYFAMRGIFNARRLPAVRKVKLFDLYVTSRWLWSCGLCYPTRQSLRALDAHQNTLLVGLLGFRADFFGEFLQNTVSKRRAARATLAALQIDPWSKRWATQAWRYWGHAVRNQLDTPLRYLVWRYSTFTLMSGDTSPGWVVNTPLRKFQLCYGTIRAASHPAIWETAAQDRVMWQQLYSLWRRHWARARPNTDLLGRQLVIINLEEAALRPFRFFPEEELSYGPMRRGEISLSLRLRYNTFDRQDQQHDLIRRTFVLVRDGSFTNCKFSARMSSLLAAQMRLYIRDMRVSWGWFFATLFELEEYASDLDRVLRDFDTLDPDDPPLSEDDVSYMHFLLAEWEVSFDHSCENVVWFFFHAHLPCWRELHLYLDELPPLDQCLAAREIQYQFRTCRNTWPEYWFLPALARYIDSHLDVLYEIPLWPYQEPAESFWDRSFDMVGDRLQQEVSELVPRFEMTCEFIAWNELDAPPRQLTALPDWVLSWLLLGLVVMIVAVVKSLLVLRTQWTEMRQDQKATQRTVAELHAQMTSMQSLLQQAVSQQASPVLAEPQSFLQPLLLEKWRETRTDLFQTVRLFGLEVQELKEKTTQLFPLFALMRKSVLPLHADIPEALKTMNEHLGNLRDNVDSLTTEEHGVYEAATQAVMNALKSLEDRLWRAQKEFKTPLAGAQAAMTQVVTTPPAEMLNLAMVYAPWLLLGLFVLAQARTAPPPSSSTAAPPDPVPEAPPKHAEISPEPAAAPEPKKTEGGTSDGATDPPLPPPASPPTTCPDVATAQPKADPSPPPATQPAPLPPTPVEQKQSETPPTSPTPPELKAFTEALKDVKAYIDDKSKVLQEVKKLLDTKTTPPTPTTPVDLGPTLETALKPLSESLSTIDSTTAGAARDLSNHMWESGGRHQAMETTLSGVHGMVRDLQNRVGTTQRKLDDWVKSWSDSAGTTLDDSPGVVKCLCQLREHQDELARYNQANEALSSKVDTVAEAVGAIATRVQSMQTLLDKMAAARPKAPPPAFPAPDIPATESAGPPPHQPPGSWHTPSQLPGSAPSNPSPTAQGLPLTTPPAYIPSIGATIQAAPGASQGVPPGASVINLSPPAQQDTVTVWMDGRAFQIPTTMVRGIN